MNAALRARHPHEPWLWRQEWIDRRIDYSHARAGFSLLLFAIAWNAFVWGVWLVAHDEMFLVVKVIVILFLAIGGVMIWAGLRSSFLGLRQRRATLLLNDVPQRPGQSFRARVEMGTVPDGEVRAYLTCRYRPGQQARTERVIWSEEVIVPRSAIQRSTERTIIPIEFAIPRNARGSEKPGVEGEVSWELRVAIGKEQAAPAVDCYFLIPLFANQQSGTGELASDVVA